MSTSFDLTREPWGLHLRRDPSHPLDPRRPLWDRMDPQLYEVTSEEARRRQTERLLALRAERAA